MSILENKLAKCYIEQEGDEENRCELTDQRLSIIKKEIHYEFPIESLRSITFHQRKLLLLVIISGILTPLILVGFFSGLFHPFIAILGIVGGVFLFYLGWIGQTTFTLNLVGEHNDFVIKNITNSLIEFAEYVNQYISNEPEFHRSLFLKINKNLDDEGLIYVLKEGSETKELYSFWQLQELLQKSDEGLLDFDFVALNPIKIRNEVKFIQSEEFTRLRPIVKGKINPEAILNRFSLESANKLFNS